jgi:DNA adenine methylase
MLHFPTPFRYPGGKTKLTPYVSEIFVENSLVDGHYVEPYAGGAGLAFSLLFKGYARYLHLNDLDKSIYSVWHSILNETEALCRYIDNVTVNVDEWKKQKAVQTNKETADLLSLGISTLFLNRTNRSGVINGGPIGGYDQQGNYKIDVRFNKKTLREQIQKIAFYKKRIQLSNFDAKDFLVDTVSNLPQNTLVNLDPPYYVKGQQLYINFYKHDDHEEISNTVPMLKQYWIITYDNVEPIKSLYSQYTPLEYKLSYSVNKKYKGKEILIADPRLKLPPEKLLKVA